MKCKKVISALLCFPLFISVFSPYKMASCNRFDVNGDGIVSCEDADWVLKWILDSNPDPRADVTGDGRVNHSDAEDILNLVLLYGLYYDYSMPAVTEEQKTNVLHRCGSLVETDTNKAIYRQCLTPVQLHRPPPFLKILYGL